MEFYKVSFVWYFPFCISKVFINIAEVGLQVIIGHQTQLCFCFIRDYLFLCGSASFEMWLNICWFVWQSDLKLKKFLHIIEDSPVFPVIYDSKRYDVFIEPLYLNFQRSEILALICVMLWNSIVQDVILIYSGYEDLKSFISHLHYAVRVL